MALAETRVAQHSQPITGGGTDGNEELTAITGAVLLVMLAVLGVTIVRVGQMLWLHLFLGLLLIGPVGLKLASTGYRFVRYYARSSAYRLKGPPHPLLRWLAPVVVLSTVAVFATGVVLLADGPSSRGTWLFWHKATFILWVGATAVHVLGHLVELPRSMRAVRHTDPTIPGLSQGGAGRAIALASAVTAGAILAIVLIPDFAAWTSAQLGHHRG